jgi:hypothetical protein
MSPGTSRAFVRPKAEDRWTTQGDDCRLFGLGDWRRRLVRRSRAYVAPIYLLFSEAGLVSDIALIVTAIGVLGVVIGLRQSYRERLRQFESRYVERYWKISDDLSLEVVRTSFSGQIIESDEKAIRRYISLSEDELEMRHYGYIADSTYEQWGEGILNQLKQGCFDFVWKQVQHEIEAKSASQYTYVSILMCAGKVKAGDNSDPLKMGTWQRTLRGLRGLNGV